MSFIEKRDSHRPSTGEAPFAINEVFFSRTDERGIIQAGNDVFQRVSGYGWDELVGAPHKIIRHPDMPKGVFWLLWDSIQKGEPMGAYVKNLAKDGLHYWVYAVVIPIEGGYISARLKPSSSRLELIKKEYANLVTLETENGISPKESADVLVESVQRMGFANYFEFAFDSLVKEQESKNAALEQASNPRLTKYQEMYNFAVKLDAETNSLSDSFKAMETVPTNMRVIAARLEPSGGSISSLSQNYSNLSQEISDWFDAFMADDKEAKQSMQATIGILIFQESTKDIWAEMAQQFTKEKRSLGDFNIEAERDTLNSITKDYQSFAEAGLKEISNETQSFCMALNILHRHILALSTTRIMCKIEGARLPVGGEGLNGIIEQLGIFQKTINEKMEKIQDSSMEIQKMATKEQNRA